uniref:Uncharacterized protein n=1 Tax=Triticum urartu TaxID=4572 RepID=A0A8R7UAC6_TRIUA
MRRHCTGERRRRRRRAVGRAAAQHRRVGDAHAAPAQRPRHHLRPHRLRPVQPLPPRRPLPPQPQGARAPRRLHRALRRVRRRVQHLPPALRLHRHLVLLGHRRARRHPRPDRRLERRLPQRARHARVRRRRRRRRRQLRLERDAGRARRQPVVRHQPGPPRRPRLHRRRPQAVQLRVLPQGRCFRRLGHRIVVPGSNQGPRGEQSVSFRPPQHRRQPFHLRQEPRRPSRLQEEQDRPDVPRAGRRRPQELPQLGLVGAAAPEAFAHRGRGAGLRRRARGLLQLDQGEDLLPGAGDVRADQDHGRFAGVGDRENAVAAGDGGHDPAAQRRRGGDHQRRHGRHRRVGGRQHPGVRARHVPARPRARGPVRGAERDRHRAAVPLVGDPPPRRPGAGRREQPAHLLQLQQRAVPDRAQPGGLLPGVPGQLQRRPPPKDHRPLARRPGGEREVRTVNDPPVRGASGGAEKETARRGRGRRRRSRPGVGDDGGAVVHDALVRDEPEAAAPGRGGDDGAAQHRGRGRGRVRGIGGDAGDGRAGAAGVLHGVRGERAHPQRGRVGPHRVTRRRRRRHASACIMYSTTRLFCSLVLSRGFCRHHARM